MSTTMLAPDPALPARDRHLDPVWVARRLAELTGRPVRPGRLVRSKYRIGESLRAVHRVELDGRDTTVTARMFPLHDGVAGGAARVATAAPSALHDVEHGTVWWWFPDDRRMHRLADVMRADPFLAEQLRLPAWAQTTVAEYAPERSLTVRAADVHDRALAYVKVYAPGTVDLDAFAGRYERAARAFAGDRTISVPRVMSRIDDVIALTPMPGVSWTALADTDRESGLQRLGAAIARFHEIPPDGIAGSFGRLQVGRVVHSAELVAAARPDVAPRILAAADRLAGGPPPGDERVLLHGDCHPKNSLFDQGCIALIDLDQAGVGSPAADIASLLARLEHGRLLGETDRATATALGEAFLAGYAGVRALPSPASLGWHVAAALIAERAVRAVNRVGTRALARLAELTDAAFDVAMAASSAPDTRGGRS